MRHPFVHKCILHVRACYAIFALLHCLLNIPPYVTGLCLLHSFICAHWSKQSQLQLYNFSVIAWYPLTDMINNAHRLMCVCVHVCMSAACLY